MRLTGATATNEEPAPAKIARRQMNLATAAMIFGGLVTHGFQMIASLGERAFSVGAGILAATR
jgi:hypothetical protein